MSVMPRLDHTRNARAYSASLLFQPRKITQSISALSSKLHHVQRQVPLQPRTINCQHFRTDTMCKFRITVTLCQCTDPACRMRNDAFGQLESEAMQKHGGHILWISTYLRDGPMCLGYFTNEDPERLMVRYGMDAKNGNSKQDCKNRVFVIDAEVKRCLVMCEPCKDTCDLGPPSPGSVKSQEWRPVGETA
ncbi:hypothetical protein J3F83DRAFT_729796 [Trichoderma novae-zelandiae]